MPSDLTKLFAEPSPISADGIFPAGAVSGGKEALRQVQQEDETLTALWDQAEADGGTGRRAYQNVLPASHYLS